MLKMNVILNDIDKIKEFVNAVSKFDADFDLRSKKYVVDAKSIMGVFSLDTSKPCELSVYCDDKNMLENIKTALTKFESKEA